MDSGWDCCIGGLVDHPKIGLDLCITLKIIKCSTGSASECGNLVSPVGL